MATALDPRGSFPYVLERERDLDDRTTWRLRFLPGPISDAAQHAMAEVEHALSDAERKAPVPLMQTLDAIIAVGLVGWSRFIDEDGHEVPFPPLVERECLGQRRQVAADEAVARIPSAADKTELVTAILKGQALTVAQAKKSLWRQG